MDIRRLGPGDEQALEKVGPQFDKAVEAAAGTKFLDSEGHHILVAYEGEAIAGFVTGVEMTHPDKGTRCFFTSWASIPAFVAEAAALPWSRRLPRLPASGIATACGC